MNLQEKEITSFLVLMMMKKKFFIFCLLLTEFFVTRMQSILLEKIQKLVLKQAKVELRMKKKFFLFFNT